MASAPCTDPQVTLAILKLACIRHLAFESPEERAFFFVHTLLFVNLLSWGESIKREFVGSHMA